MIAKTTRGGWLACGISAAICFTLTGATAQDRPASKHSAKDSAALALVREALHAEIDGRARERTQYLRDAMQYSSDLPMVRWSNGDVHGPKGWQSSDAAGSALEKDPLRVRYLELRAKSPDTVDGHLKLVTYCQLAALKDEWKAHLSRIIELQPEHLEARQKLGFRKVGERWWSCLLYTSPSPRD